MASLVRPRAELQYGAPQLGNLARGEFAPVFSHTGACSLHTTLTPVATVVFKGSQAASGD